MALETKAHEIIIRFCRWDGTTRLFGGHYGMRCPMHPKPGAECIVCSLEWSEQPNLAEASTWEQVYVQLAVSGRIDRARVEQEAYTAELKAEKEHEERRAWTAGYGYGRKRYRR